VLPVKKSEQKLKYSEGLFLRYIARSANIFFLVGYSFRSNEGGGGVIEFGFVPLGAASRAAESDDSLRNI
jgi:hypothetical protein